nr:hypothetical protein B0A51_09252 [Rachicladosporium sp. CCFEE 5018]
MLRSALLATLVAALSPFALADVEFVTPAAGGTLAAGAVSITWKDSGTAPALSLLAGWSIQLMVGGNTDATSVAITSFAGNMVSGNSYTATIPAAASGPATNGYYLKMTSAATSGGQVINFSKRFSISGMTGVVPAAAAAGVAASAGSLDGPATINSVSNNAGGNAGSGAAAGGDEYAVPYGQQTGGTKYAPMQPIPPTKITKKNFTPLNPTSAVVIARTNLPPAQGVVTTLTQSQTFSVVSVENTAAPVAGPTGDMAKFLNRWKD